MGVYCVFHHSCQLGDIALKVLMGWVISLILVQISYGEWGGIHWSMARRYPGSPAKTEVYVWEGQTDQGVQARECVVCSACGE